MTDSVQIWKPGFRILDDSGDPVAGGKIKFYDAGTSTPRTVYTDKGLSANASTVITADSSGVPQVSSTDVVAYTNTSDYKVVITDSDDNVLITVDNLAGALDTSSYLTTASPWNVPAQSKTSNYTLLSADLGNIITCDASGGAFTITLLAAATAGDGATYVIKKTDSSTNGVTIDGNASETIDGNTTIVLTEQYASVMLICDGSNWHIGSAEGVSSTNHEQASTATYATLSTAMNADDTIPQITEGDEIDTVAFAASSATATVLITFNCFLSANANEDACVALFTDSNADAIHATIVSVGNGDYSQVALAHYYTPGTTASITYKIRGGPCVGANNIYVNGSSSARLFGGVASAELIVREL